MFFSKPIPFNSKTVFTKGIQERGLSVFWVLKFESCLP